MIISLQKEEEAGTINNAGKSVSPGKGSSTESSAQLTTSVQQGQPMQQQQVQQQMQQQQMQQQHQMQQQQVQHIVQQQQPHVQQQQVQQQQHQVQQHQVQQQQVQQQQVQQPPQEQSQIQQQIQQQNQHQKHMKMQQQQQQQKQHPQQQVQIQQQNQQHHQIKKQTISQQQQLRQQQSRQSELHYNPQVQLTQSEQQIIRTLPNIAPKTQQIQQQQAQQNTTQMQQIGQRQPPMQQLQTSPLKTYQIVQPTSTTQLSPSMNLHTFELPGTVIQTSPPQHLVVQPNILTSVLLPRTPAGDQNQVSFSSPTITPLQQASSVNEQSNSSLSEAVRSLEELLSTLPGTNQTTTPSNNVDVDLDTSDEGMGLKIANSFTLQDLASLPDDTAIQLSAEPCVGDSGNNDSVNSSMDSTLNFSNQQDTLSSLNASFQSNPSQPSPISTAQNKEGASLDKNDRNENEQTVSSDARISDQKDHLTPNPNCLNQGHEVLMNEKTETHNDLLLDKEKSAATTQETQGTESEKKCESDKSERSKALDQESFSTDQSGPKLLTNTPVSVNSESVSLHVNSDNKNKQRLVCKKFVKRKNKMYHKGISKKNSLLHKHRKMAIQKILQPKKNKTVARCPRKKKQKKPKLEIITNADGTIDILEVVDTTPNSTPDADEKHPSTLFSNEHSEKQSADEKDDRISLGTEISHQKNSEITNEKETSTCKNADPKECASKSVQKQNVKKDLKEFSVENKNLDKKDLKCITGDENVNVSVSSASRKEVKQNKLLNEQSMPVIMTNQNPSAECGSSIGKSHPESKHKHKKENNVDITQPKQQQRHKLCNSTVNEDREKIVLSKVDNKSVTTKKNTLDKSFCGDHTQAGPVKCNKNTNGAKLAENERKLATQAKHDSVCNQNAKYDKKAIGGRSRSTSLDSVMSNRTVTPNADEETTKARDKMKEIGSVQDKAKKSEANIKLLSKPASRFSLEGKLELEKKHSSSKPLPPQPSSSSTAAAAAASHSFSNTDHTLTSHKDKKRLQSENKQTDHSSRQHHVEPKNTLPPSHHKDPHVLKSGRNSDPIHKKPIQIPLTRDSQTISFSSHDEHNNSSEDPRYKSPLKGSCPSRNFTTNDNVPKFSPHKPDPRLSHLHVDNKDKEPKRHIHPSPRHRRPSAGSTLTVRKSADASAGHSEVSAPPGFDVLNVIMEMERTHKSYPKHIPEPKKVKADDDIVESPPTSTHTGRMIASPHSSLTEKIPEDKIEQENLLLKKSSNKTKISLKEYRSKRSSTSSQEKDPEKICQIFDEAFDDMEKQRQLNEAEKDLENNLKVKETEGQTNKADQSNNTDAPEVETCRTAQIVNTRTSTKEASSVQKDLSLNKMSTVEKSTIQKDLPINALTKETPGTPKDKSVTKKPPTLETQTTHHDDSVTMKTATKETAPVQKDQSIHMETATFETPAAQKDKSMTKKPPSFGTPPVKKDLSVNEKITKNVTPTVQKDQPVHNKTSTTEAPTTQKYKLGTKKISPLIKTTINKELSTKEIPTVKKGLAVNKKTSTLQTTAEKTKPVSRISTKEAQKVTKDQSSHRKTSTVQKDHSIIKKTSTINKSSSNVVNGGISKNNSEGGDTTKTPAGVEEEDKQSDLSTVKKVNIKKADPLSVELATQYAQRETCSMKTVSCEKSDSKAVNSVQEPNCDSAKTHTSKSSHKSHLSAEDSMNKKINVSSKQSTLLISDVEKSKTAKSHVEHSANVPENKIDFEQRISDKQLTTPRTFEYEGVVELVDEVLKKDSDQTKSSAPSSTLDNTHNTESQGIPSSAQTGVEEKSQIRTPKSEEKTKNNGKVVTHSRNGADVSTKSGVDASKKALLSKDNEKDDKSEMKSEKKYLSRIKDVSGAELKGKTHSVQKSSEVRINTAVKDKDKADHKQDLASTKIGKTENDTATCVDENVEEKKASTQGITKKKAEGKRSVDEESNKNPVKKSDNQDDVNNDNEKVLFKVKVTQKVRNTPSNGKVCVEVVKKKPGPKSRTCQDQTIATEKGMKTSTSKESAICNDDKVTSHNPKPAGKATNTDSSGKAITCDGKKKVIVAKNVALQNQNATRGSSDKSSVKEEVIAKDKTKPKLVDDIAKSEISDIKDGHSEDGSGSIGKILKEKLHSTNGISSDTDTSSSNPMIQQEQNVAVPKGSKSSTNAVHMHKSDCEMKLKNKQEISDQPVKTSALKSKSFEPKHRSGSDKSGKAETQMKAVKETISISSEKGNVTEKSVFAKSITSKQDKSDSSKASKNIKDINEKTEKRLKLSLKSKRKCESIDEMSKSSKRTVTTVKENNSTPLNSKENQIAQKPRKIKPGHQDETVTLNVKSDTMEKKCVIKSRKTFNTAISSQKSSADDEESKTSEVLQEVSSKKDTCGNVTTLTPMSDENSTMDSKTLTKSIKKGQLCDVVKKSSQNTSSLKKAKLQSALKNETNKKAKAATSVHGETDLKTGKGEAVNPIASEMAKSNEEDSLGESNGTFDKERRTVSINKSSLEEGKSGNLAYENLEVAINLTDHNSDVEFDPKENSEDWFSELSPNKTTDSRKVIFRMNDTDEVANIVPSFPSDMKIPEKAVSCQGEILNTGAVKKAKVLKLSDNKVQESMKPQDKKLISGKGIEGRPSSALVKSESSETVKSTPRSPNKLNVRKRQSSTDRCKPSQPINDKLKAVSSRKDSSTKQERYQERNQLPREGDRKIKESPQKRGVSTSSSCSPSPAKRRRSDLNISPRNRHHSRSPQWNRNAHGSGTYFTKRYSRSPHSSKRSRSPQIPRRSRSPRSLRRSRSPQNIRRTRSPYKSRRSRSPRRHYRRSRSPCKLSRSRSNSTDRFKTKKSAYDFLWPSKKEKPKNNHDNRTEKLTTNIPTAKATIFRPAESSVKDVDESLYAVLPDIKEQVWINREIGRDPEKRQLMSQRFFNWIRTNSLLMHVDVDRIDQLSPNECQDIRAKKSHLIREQWEILCESERQRLGIMTGDDVVRERYDAIKKRYSLEYNKKVFCAWCEREGGIHSCTVKEQRRRVNYLRLELNMVEEEYACVSQQALIGQLHDKVPTQWLLPEEGNRSMSVEGATLFLKKQFSWKEFKYISTIKMDIEDTRAQLRQTLKSDKQRVS